MRTLAILLFLVGLACPWTGRAVAEPLLFAPSGGQAEEHAASLEIALRGYGFSVRTIPVTDGLLPLERAAEVQRLLRESGARVALWEEPEIPVRLRALRAESDAIVEAPLPAPRAEMEPGAFARVAASLVMEAVTSRRSLLTAADSAQSGSGPPTDPKRGADAKTPPAPPSAEPTAQRFRRFYLRANFAYGLGRIHNGLPLAEAPSPALLDPNSLEMTEIRLQQAGYACKLTRFDADRLQASECRPDVDRPGFIPTPAFTFALGANILPRLSLSLTARLPLDAGPGAMAGLLLGTQIEALLTAPRSQGLWMAVAGGVGFGRVHLRSPPGPLGEGPWVSSGLGSLRLGALLGYRFHPSVGVVCGMMLHLVLPEPLFMMEPSLGLEFRL